MVKARLGFGDVEVGKPLPFHLMDAAGVILLRCGVVVASEDQLQRLIERGTYYEAIEDESIQSESTERIPVYRLIAGVIDEYALLMGQPFDAEQYGRLAQIAREIAKLTALDADAALGFNLLYKEGRYSVRHAFATAMFADLLMRALKQDVETIERTVMGALCMNLGMMELQDELYRQQVPLTPEQKQAIVLHPQRTAKLLAEQGCHDQIVLDIVLDHHETVNGTGYARRRKAPDLGLPAQVVSLADRYCAAVSERAFRPATLPHIAARDLLSRQGATIDTVLASHFIKLIGIYPPGAVVSLANGEIAVVVRRTLQPLQPIVRSLKSRNGVRYANLPKRLTSKDIYAIKDAASAEYLMGVDLSGLWPLVDEAESAEGEAAGGVS